MTTTPMFDALVAEQDYTPGAFKFRTHDEFVADHKAAWRKRKTAAKKPPAPAPARKTPAKKTPAPKG